MQSYDFTPSIARPSASTGCSIASTASSAQEAKTYPPLQHREDRRGTPIASRSQLPALAEGDLVLESKENNLVAKRRQGAHRRG